MVSIPSTFYNVGLWRINFQTCTQQLRPDEKKKKKNYNFIDFRRSILPLQKYPLEVLVSGHPSVPVVPLPWDQDVDVPWLKPVVGLTRTFVRRGLGGLFLRRTGYETKMVILWESSSRFPRVGLKTGCLWHPIIYTQIFLTSGLVRWFVRFSLYKVRMTTLKL